MIKLMLTLCLLSTSVAAIAVEKQIVINQDQIEHLNIKVGALKTSQNIPLLYAPAKVVVPSSHERLVTSTQPGLLVQLFANLGDFIKKDQLLAAINSPELVTLQRDFLTANNEMSLAELDYNRDKKLLEEGVIADRRWHETETLYRTKTAHFDSARQLLEIAGMNALEINQLAKTGQLNSVLNVRAPISGVILERLASVGTRLDIQAPIYRLADLSELWLEINIPQERAHSLQIGDQVLVDNTNDIATISLIGLSVNKDNQTVIARAALNAKSLLLRVGQTINVQIFQKNQQHSFKVESAAISQYQGHNYIFVRNQQGFDVVEITINGKQDHEVLISGPLTGNEQIALQGSAALKANWLGLGEGE